MYQIKFCKDGIKSCFEYLVLRYLQGWPYYRCSKNPSGKKKKKERKKRGWKENRKGGNKGK